MKALRCLILVMSLGQFFPVPAYAKRLSYDEQDKVIASIILQLPRYAKNGEEEKPTLCLMTERSLSKTLATLNASKQVYSSIRQAWPNKTSQCRYAFADTRSAARKLLKTSGQTLTIGNYDNFIDEGGAVAIVDVQGRIEIQLNITAAKNKGFSFSPDLIELSKRVIQ